MGYTWDIEVLHFRAFKLKKFGGGCNHPSQHIHLDKYHLLPRTQMTIVLAEKALFWGIDLQKSRSFGF